MFKIDVRDIRFQILGICTLLIMLGFIFIYNASIPYANRLGRGDMYFFIKQFVSVIVGFMALFTAYKIPLNFYRKHVMLIFAVTLLLLIVVLFMPALNGAKRWISLFSVTFQPSEIAKFSVVLYLAHYLDKKDNRMWDLMTGFLPATLLVGLLAALIIIEPDFGTTMLIVIVAFSMFLVGGARLMHIFGIVGIVFPILIAVMFVEDYRKARFFSFLNPWEDRFGIGYQLTQSLMSTGSGGLMGKGVGNSIQKLSFLPEAHTDFIFAIIAEETGIIGATCVLFLILYLFNKQLSVAYMHKDKFRRLLVFGLSLMFFVQSFVHAYVVLGMLPTKGLTLPFISYGGTAIVMSMFFIGVILRSIEELEQS